MPKNMLVVLIVAWNLCPVPRFGAFKNLGDLRSTRVKLLLRRKRNPFALNQRKPEDRVRLCTQSSGSAPSCVAAVVDGAAILQAKSEGPASYTCLKTPVNAKNPSGFLRPGKNGPVFEAAFMHTCIIGGSVKVGLR